MRLRFLNLQNIWKDRFVTVYSARRLVFRVQWLLASQRYTFPRQATLPDAIFQHKLDQREYFYKQEKKKLGVEFNKKH